MNRKYLLVVIILVLITVGYVIYENGFAPKVTPSLTIDTDERTIPSGNDVSDDTLKYQNEDMGFEFSYPVKNGAIKPHYYPGPTAPLEDLITSFIGLPGVTVENRGYDSGTDIPKEPVCPDKVVCASKVNAVGTTFFETAITFMGGTILRKEFPISASSSLVVQYDSNSEAELIAELETLADTVIVK